MTDFNGKTVVITGGSRGIGRALTHGFAATGAQVCCAVRDVAAVQADVEAIRAKGGTVVAAHCDVADPSSIDTCFATASAAFGGIDIVIANAGSAGVARSVEESEPDAWEAVIRINLLGAYHTMRAAIPHLRRRGAGKIIAIGSGGGRKPVPNGSAYACSKAGLSMLVRVLALELAPFDIAVNELIPGPVDTDMVRTAGQDELMEQLSKVEWFKQPEDVVPMALFMASQPDRGPSGQTFSLLHRDL